MELSIAPEKVKPYTSFDVYGLYNVNGYLKNIGAILSETPFSYT